MFVHTHMWLYICCLREWARRPCLRRCVCVYVCVRVVYVRVFLCMRVCECLKCMRIQLHCCVSELIHFMTLDVSLERHERALTLAFATLHACTYKLICNNVCMCTHNHVTHVHNIKSIEACMHTYIQMYLLPNGNFENILGANQETQCVSAFLWDT